MNLKLIFHAFKAVKLKLNLINLPTNTYLANTLFFVGDGHCHCLYSNYSQRLDGQLFPVDLMRT